MWQPRRTILARLSDEREKFDTVELRVDPEIGKRLGTG